jgi:D-amino-acid dehydrogenase
MSPPPQSARHAVVLGAGMVGTCTALHLQQRGFEVVLVDRREPGQETSYGNAGLIQREAVEPYAFPRQWRKLVQVAMGLGADVHLHWTALPALAGPLWRYFQASEPSRLAHQAQAFSRLIAHCLTEHQALIGPSGASALVQPSGYLDVFRTPQAWENAVQDAERLRLAFGVSSQVFDGAELARAEPALQRRMAGAIHWLDPWAVNDPGALVRHYARLFEQRGGTLLRADVHGLRPQGVGWQVRLPDGVLDTPAAVVALGPWSGDWLRPLGYRLPLYVKRGYHQHYASGGTLKRPVLDAEQGFVLVPTPRGTRLTTGAEFAHRDAPPTPVQVAKAEKFACELMDLRDPQDDPPWMGARPCTPDMLPVMGRAPHHPGLWFNFGHSHQGFTLGPVAGRLIAELMAGETPFVDPAPYRPQRF